MLVSSYHLHKTNNCVYFIHLQQNKLLKQPLVGIILLILHRHKFTFKYIVSKYGTVKCQHDQLLRYSAKQEEYVNYLPG